MVLHIISGGGVTLIGGTSYKINKGKTLINGTGQNILFKPTWKKYNANVSYTLAYDIIVDNTAEKCPPNDNTYLSSYIYREYGSWPYFKCVVSGRPNPVNFVSFDNSTGKMQWTNDGSFRQWSDSSGGWSPSIREIGSASDQQYNSVLFFHFYGPTGNDKYNPDHYKAFTYYMHDDSTYPTYYINLAWAYTWPSYYYNELYATVLYYKSPKSQMYHFYSNPSYSIGTFVETVTADSEAAYPTNGVHTDGYWYIRQ